MLKDPRDIPQILLLTHERLKVDQEYLNGLEAFCYCAIGHGPQVVFLSKEGQEVTGFVAATLMNWDWRPTVVIQSCASIRRIPTSVRRELLTALEAWGHDHQAFCIVGFSHLPNKILKRWGFRQSVCVVERDSPLSRQ